MSYSAPSPMRSGPRSGVLARLGTRLFAVAALVGVSLLGNLRLQASEARQPMALHTVGGGDPSRVFDRAQALAELTSVEASASAMRPQSVSVPVGVEADPRDDVEDAVRVVPAIYAWDPDVRFVYYRHVSKWM